MHTPLEKVLVGDGLDFLEKLAVVEKKIGVLSIEFLAPYITKHRQAMAVLAEDAVDVEVPEFISATEFLRFVRQGLKDTHLQPYVADLLEEIGSNEINILKDLAGTWTLSADQIDTFEQALVRALSSIKHTIQGDIPISVLATIPGLLMTYFFFKILPNLVESDVEDILSYLLGSITASVSTIGVLAVFLLVFRVRGVRELHALMGDLKMIKV